MKMLSALILMLGLFWRAVIHKMCCDKCSNAVMKLIVYLGSIGHQGNTTDINKYLEHTI